MMNRIQNRFPTNTIKTFGNSCITVTLYEVVKPYYGGEPRRKLYDEHFLHVEKRLNHAGVTHDIEFAKYTTLDSSETIQKCLMGAEAEMNMMMRAQDIL